ncbi:hypothetical protein L1887_29931 [Cichorium endivia]|nr:hypothetical protein L1887_29931 [Cichorium endivia]
MTPNWKCLGIASIEYNIKPLKWDAQIRVAFSLIKCQISGIIFVEMLLSMDLGVTIFIMTRESKTPSI